MGNVRKMYNDAVERNPVAVTKWREFMAANANDPAFEDTDFDSLSVGFFIASGASVDDAFWLAISWDNL